MSASLMTEIVSDWVGVLRLTALVAGDVTLAQKIALETFESGALSVAKRFVPNGPLC